MPTTSSTWPISSTCTTCGWRLGGSARRLRSSSPASHPRSSGPRYAQVKAIADALGERRDRDVTIVALEGFAAGMPAPDRPGVETLIERLRAEQAEANAALVPFVDAGRLAALSGLLSELVAAAEGAPA